MIRFSCCALFLAAAFLQAGEVAYEYTADYSYVGGAPTKLDHGRAGDVSEQADLLHFALSRQVGDGPLLRLGVEWRRYSFGLPSSAPLPNTLQGASVIVGADMEVSSWLVRIEAQPGFYGAEEALLNGKNFNIPCILGGSYIVSPDLQWVAGLSFDLDRAWVVLPGVGVRWKFAEKWTLNALPPNPRLEYTLSDSLKLYAGGDFKTGTFRTDDSFGNAHRNARLDSAVLEYNEFRVGAGVDWKIARSITLDAEAGYMPFRDVDFHRAKASFETYSGAPYGQIALKAEF